MTTKTQNYYLQDGFAYRYGKVSCMTKLNVRVGSNQNLSMNDVIDMIPISQQKDVNLFFISISRVYTKSARDRLIKSNAIKNKRSIETSDKKDLELTSDQEIAKSELTDYDEYERLVGTSEPIVSFALRVLIVSDSREHIEEFIETTNLHYSQQYDGLSLEFDAVSAEVQNNLFSLLDEPENELSSTASNFSKMNFSVDPGISDEKGWPFGVDAYSLTASTALVDFDRYFQKQAFICMQPSARLLQYDTDTRHIPVSSVCALFASQQSYCRNARVTHLILNDVDLHSCFESSEKFKQECEFVDMSRITVNPLQGFGDINDVMNIFIRIKEKIINIFDVIKDLSLSDSDRATILEALEHFYFSHSLWSADADKYPKRTYITQIKEPELYPTMGMFLNEFTSMAYAAQRENAEIRSDRIKVLESLLRDALASYIHIIGRTTSLQPQRSRQAFYSYSNIESDKVKQIQYLNTLEPISANLKKGDVLVLHGVNQLWLPVLKMTHSIFESLKKRGIRLLLAFDTISSMETPSAKLCDVFDLKGLFYDDLDADVDWSLIGTCLPAEVDKLSDAFNAHFSSIVSSALQTKAFNLALFHRRYDMKNAFIYIRPRL